MKASRYILFCLSIICIAPIALFYLDSILSLPEDSLLGRCCYVPNMFISYQFYEAGASRAFVSTEGHIALLTFRGIAIVYLLPALICFIAGLLLKKKHSHEIDAA